MPGTLVFSSLRLSLITPPFDRRTCIGWKLPSDAQLVCLQSCARRAHDALVDPCHETHCLQLGQRIDDGDSAAFALLADHLFNGPRPVFGDQREQDALGACGRDGIVTHGSSLWLEAPEDCSGK